MDREVLISTTPTPTFNLNNEIRILESEETHEIEKILARLSAMVSENKDSLLLDYTLIVSIAIIFSRAELSIKLDGTLFPWFSVKMAS